MSSVTRTRDDWTPWYERTKAELARLAGAEIHVGILGGADSELLRIAAVHEFGATIHPRNAKNLAIPLRPDMKGKSPRDVEGAFFLNNGENCFICRMRNWPVQIKLAPVHAPYFEDAKLLIAADCTAYAYANFHQEFMRGKVTLIGCPKLDAVDYSEKLTEILRSNDIQSVTILRMEVPCCGGLEMAAKKALQTSGKFIPWQVVTISIDGKILD